MVSVLDGYSRSILAWDIRESMKEEEVELAVERAKHRFPDARPRIITDRGPQFVSKDFKEFIRLSGMTHVKTSPYYPQSNGKIERYHRTIKEKTIRATPPSNISEAQRQVNDFVKTYNEERLHSAIGYVTPQDKMLGREREIYAIRDERLGNARALRAIKRKRREGEVMTKIE